MLKNKIISLLMLGSISLFADDILIQNNNITGNNISKPKEIKLEENCTDLKKENKKLKEQIIVLTNIIKKNELNEKNTTAKLLNLLKNSNVNNKDLESLLISYKKEKDNLEGNIKKLEDIDVKVSNIKYIIQNIENANIDRINFLKFLDNISENNKINKNLKVNSIELKNNISDLILIIKSNNKMYYGKYTKNEVLENLDEILKYLNNI